MPQLNTEANVKHMTWSRASHAFITRRREQQKREEEQRLPAEAKVIKRHIDKDLKNWPELATVLQVETCFPPFGRASDDDVAAALLLPTTRENLRVKCEIIGSRESNSKPGTLANHAARLSKVLQYVGAGVDDTLERFLVEDSQAIWDIISADDTVGPSTKSHYATSVQWAIDHRVLSLTPAQIATVRPVWSTLFSANKTDSLQRTATSLANTDVLDYNDILRQADQFAKNKPRNKNAQLLDLTLHFYREANIRNEFSSINIAEATGEEIARTPAMPLNFIAIPTSGKLIVVLDSAKTSRGLGRISLSLSQELSDRMRVFFADRIKLASDKRAAAVAAKTFTPGGHLARELFVPLFTTNKQLVSKQVKSFLINEMGEPLANISGLAYIRQSILSTFYANDPDVESQALMARASGHALGTAKAAYVRRTRTFDPVTRSSTIETQLDDFPPQPDFVDEPVEDIAPPKRRGRPPKQAPIPAPAPAKPIPKAPRKRVRYEEDRAYQAPRIVNVDPMRPKLRSQRPELVAGAGVQALPLWFMQLHGAMNAFKKQRT